MKKLFLLLAGVFLLTACEKEPNTVPVQDDPTIKQSTETIVDYRVSKSTAINRAIKAVEGLKGRAESRAEALRVAKAEVVGSRVASRSGNAADTLFYLINFDDNQGFALVAADERNTDVYMMAEEGSLDLETLDPESPINYFMDCAEGYAAYELANDPPEYIPELDSTFREPSPLDYQLFEIGGETYRCRFEPIRRGTNCFLSTQWHQQAPYNNRCFANGQPAYAGCVAIAVAQIMAYHRHPATYNWNAILQYPTVSSINTVAANAVATLVSDIGQAVNMNYGSIADGEGSSSNIYQAYAALNYDYPYRSDIVRNYSMNNIEHSIETQSPVYVRGVSSSGTGHAWVIDAYNYEIMRYHCYDPDTLEFVFTTESAPRDHRVRNNLGWGTTPVWTLSGMFEFGGQNFSSTIKTICLIKPM